MKKLNNYLVLVDNIYLVTVEATSNCSAEHMCLDKYNGYIMF